MIQISEITKNQPKMHQMLYKTLTILITILTNLTILMTILTIPIPLEKCLSWSFVCERE